MSKIIVSNYYWLKKNREGFTTIVTVLILGMIASTIMLSIFVVSIDSSIIDKTIRSSIVSRQNANTCAEIALSKVKESALYIGGETYNIGTGTCTIVGVTGDGNEDRLVKVTGTKDNITTKTEVWINVVSPTTDIAYWKDVDVFSADPATSGTTGDWSVITLQDQVTLSLSGTPITMQYFGNYLYVITTDRNTNLYTYDVSDINNISLVSTFGASRQLTDISVSEDGYVFLSSTNNNNEIIIVDVRNPTLPVEVSSIDLTQRRNPTKIFYSNDLIVVGRASSNSSQEVAIIDISDRSAPSILSEIELGRTVNDIRIQGNYLLIGSSNNTKELTIYDISDPTNPSFITDYDNSGKANANIIESAPGVVYLGMSDDTISIVDISTPANPGLLSTVTANDTLFDIDLLYSSGLLFTGNSGRSNEFEIFDVSDTYVPVLLSSFNADNVYAVEYDLLRDIIFSLEAGSSDTLVVYEPN